MTAITVYVMRPMSLKDLEALAIEQGYRAWYVSDGAQLNVDMVDTLVQWYALKKQADGSWFDLWYDDEDDYRKLARINPSAIVVAQHHLKARVQLLPLIQLILQRFDGFAECKSSLTTTYNAETVLTIPPECG